MQVTTSKLRLAVDLFTEGTITVAWGDGSSETIFMTSGETSFWFEREHAYVRASPHKITLTGDLAKVVGVTVESEDVDSCNPWRIRNLGSLPVLASFTSYSNVTFGRLDFSGNLYIRGLILPQASAKELKLASEHNLTFIDLNGSDSEYDFDEIADSVHANAVLENIQMGYLRFVNYGTLEPATIEKLNDLRNNYGWNIVLG
jgi:hypothetical protein